MVGLLSVVLEKPGLAPAFFDALDVRAAHVPPERRPGGGSARVPQVAKGPGFGTNFTLACPYTPRPGPMRTQTQFSSVISAPLRLKRAWS